MGRKVTLWRKGDRVVTLLSQSHLYGPFTPAIAQSGLGGSLDGTLRQYGVFNQLGLVRAPKNLSYREASTLSCAAVTSWNALYGLKPLKPGETVLVLGTGGVSIFALQVRTSLSPIFLLENNVQHSSRKLREPRSLRRRPLMRKREFSKS